MPPPIWAGPPLNLWSPKERNDFAPTLALTTSLASLLQKDSQDSPERHPSPQGLVKGLKVKSIGEDGRKHMTEAIVPVVGYLRAVATNRRSTTCPSVVRTPFPKHLGLKSG